MYGNFNAIKRRQKLRKEKTDSRSSTLEKRKDNLLSKDSEEIKERFSDTEIEESIKNIRENHHKIRRNHIVLFIISVTLVIFLAVWLYAYLN